MCNDTISLKGVFISNPCIDDCIINQYLNPQHPSVNKSSVLNEEAAQLYQHNRQQFLEKAKDWSIRYGNGYVTRKVSLQMHEIKG